MKVHECHRRLFREVSPVSISIGDTVPILRCSPNARSLTGDSPLEVVIIKAVAVNKMETSRT